MKDLSMEIGQEEFTKALTRDFPEMPESFRERIGETLSEQLRMRVPFHHRRVGRAAAAAVVAVLVCGGTVFAAAYRLRLEHTSPHEVALSVADTEEAFVPSEVPEVEMTLNYLPDNLERDEKEGEGGYSYRGTNEHGDFGYAIGAPMLMDETEQLSAPFVTDSELMTIDGHDAAYVERRLSSDTDWKNLNLYVTYPELHRMVYLWGWGHASKDELIRIAENITLKETGNKVPSDTLSSWSAYVDARNHELAEDGTISQEFRYRVSAEEMANMHKIGESFFAGLLTDAKTKKQSTVSATVKEVKVSDDLSLLSETNPWYGDYAAYLDETGKLGTTERNFIKNGDGRTTLPQVIRTDEPRVKLVYVTMDYTNTGENDLHDVFYSGRLMAIVEEDDAFRMMYPDSTCDAVKTGLVGVGTGEMWYHAVPGEPDNLKNYIRELKAGETKTIALAWLVTEDELPNLFLSVNADGGYEFTDEMLATGLVDLR